MNWTGEGLERTPLEVTIHSSLSESDRHYTLPLRGFHVDHDTRFVRVYTEYAPDGDLHDFIKQYQPGGSLNRDGGEQIPEPFVWYVFRALVESCLVQHQGHVANPTGEWGAIVHRDLKPANGMHRSQPMRPL